MSEETERNAKIHVVIGDGGIKSLAALPLLEFLNLMEIKIDTLIGCGGGALAAALVAKDVPFSEIPGLMSQVYNYDMISHPDYTSLFALLRVPFFSYSITDSLLQSENLENACKKLFGSTKMEELKLPLRIQVTNLQTASGTLLDKGSLSKLIYASIIPYPLFSPAFINQQWYVGGAYSASLPILSLSGSREDLIIAVNIERGNENPANNFAEFFSNSLSKSFSVAQMAQRTIAIDYIEPKIAFVNLKLNGGSIWDSKNTGRILLEARNSFLSQKRGLMRTIHEFRGFQ